QRAFTWLAEPFTLTALNEVVEAALHATPLDDDIEILSARPNWLALRLRCKMETADRILQFLRAMATDLPGAEREHVAMAFREILLNAIEHGGGSDPGKYVTISYVRAKHALLYYVRDPGPGFSLDEIPHAAVSNSLEEPFGHVEVRNER